MTSQPYHICIIIVGGILTHKEKAMQTTLIKFEIWNSNSTFLGGTDLTPLSIFWWNSMPLLSLTMFFIFIFILFVVVFFLVLLLLESEDHKVELNLINFWRSLREVLWRFRHYFITHNPWNNLLGGKKKAFSRLLFDLLTLNPCKEWTETRDLFFNGI